MSKELVISAAPHETRVAILEEGQLCEIYIEREKEYALVGSIYKGRVTRVLPGMQSAFVEIGLDGDAFLYVSDFLENLEDYDHVASPAEVRIEKAEPSGHAVLLGQTTSEVQASQGAPAEQSSSSDQAAASSDPSGSLDQAASSAPYGSTELAPVSDVPLESTSAAPVLDPIILPGETRAAHNSPPAGQPGEPSSHSPASSQYNNRTSYNRPPDRPHRDSRGGFGRDRGPRQRSPSWPRSASIKICFPSTLREPPRPATVRTAPPGSSTRWGRTHSASRRVLGQVSRKNSLAQPLAGRIFVWAKPARGSRTVRLPGSVF